MSACVASVWCPSGLFRQFRRSVLGSSHQPWGSGIMIAPERDTLEGETVTDAEKNKQTVLAYYNMAFNERKPAEAAQKYGGPHYIQHNPQAPDGFEAFVQFVEGFAEQFPEMSLDIKRAVAEGRSEERRVGKEGRSRWSP